MYLFMLPFYIFFFFSSRRRHTRYIGDWSSDVCSSDLRVIFAYGLVNVRGLVLVQPEKQRRVQRKNKPLIRRSEERRVGKECRSRWSPGQLKKKKVRSKADKALRVGTRNKYMVGQRRDI